MISKKTAILIGVSMAAFLGPFSQTAYAPSLPELGGFFHVNTVMVNLTISIFTTVLAISSFVFGGLAAVAPQDSKNAAKELERAVNRLGLKGVIINSHINGEYLDDQKFWDVLAAAEALDVPLYLHPNTPSPQMVQPFLPRALDAAIYGFACETGLHALRMIVGGVFDRFPKLQVVLGHLGEALPFWLYRIDFMHGGIVRFDRCPGVRPLKRPPSEVLRQNFHYTTSGMCWEPAVMYVHQLMGADRVMYAMDYPYQVVADEVSWMDGLPLSAEHKKMFFQTNAERVFRLPVHAGQAKPA